MNHMSHIPMSFRTIQLTVDAPKEMDVLCGSKSKALSGHPGNVALRIKVEACLEEYENTKSKQERITINRSIIQHMRRKNGSRFLKQNKDGTWSIAEEQAVRDKVSHAIRHASVKKQKAAATKKTVTLDAIRIGEFDEDCHDVEFSKAIARVYRRQQEILNAMMDAADDLMDPIDISNSDSEPEEELIDFLGNDFQF